MRENSNPSRRGFLKGAAAALAAVVPLTGESARAAEGAATARRCLRFSHPTDIHVQPELHGAEGMAAAFRHMFALPDPPQLVLTGGDLPMDTASAGRERSAKLWELFKKVLGDSVPSAVPVHHTIGNHDIWGRDKEACGATGNESVYGKRWFLDSFGYPQTYYSFDRAGWHFIVLDSFDLDALGKDYTSHIVGEQLDWLKADLHSTPTATPTVVITHVPIISTANFFDQKEFTADGDIGISRMRMHVDHRALEQLFRSHGNVKLCLSGHLHLLDRVEYNGITYVCDGAVCGDKWKGPRRQTPEGYGIIDLYDDGTFRHQYVPYGWHAKA